MLHDGKYACWEYHLGLSDVGIGFASGFVGGFYYWFLLMFEEKHIRSCSVVLISSKVMRRETIEQCWTVKLFGFLIHHSAPYLIRSALACDGWSFRPLVAIGQSMTHSKDLQVFWHCQSDSRPVMTAEACQYDAGLSEVHAAISDWAWWTRAHLNRGRLQGISAPVPKASHVG